jgi:hypothetical protein
MAQVSHSINLDDQRGSGAERGIVKQGRTEKQRIATYERLGPKGEDLA